MTLIDKPWLKQETTRLFLSGESQEKIAIELNISVGTVNAFVNELMESDDTIELQRQIAIISKKKGISIQQLAVNLRCKNLVNQTSIDDKKIEKFYHAMEIWCNKYSIPVDKIVNYLFSIIEITLRENIEPHKLREEVELKIAELSEIKDQIKMANNLHEESKTRIEKEQKELKITQRDLSHIRQIIERLELYDSEPRVDYFALAKSFIDFKNMGYNSRTIISAYENFENLTKANEKLDLRLEQKERILEDYALKVDEEELRWEEHIKAVETIARLIKDGLREEDIFAVAHVLRNDFPKNEVPKLIEEIRKYGSLAASRSRLRRYYEEETVSLSEILKDLAANTNSDMF